MTPERRKGGARRAGSTKEEDWNDQEIDGEINWRRDRFISLVREEVEEEILPCEL
jgi:hypothetical protein